MKKYLILPLALVLTACGGGGSGSDDTNTPTPAPQPEPIVAPVGIWVGEITYTNGSIDDAYALIAPNGEARFIDSDEQGRLQVNAVDHKNFTGTVKSFGTGYGTGSISGTYTEKNLKGEAIYGGTKTSDFEFTKSPQSNDIPSLEAVQGNYTNTNYTSSVSIDSDGFIYGSDVNGCQYSGQVSIPDSSVNIYRIMVQVNSCGEFNGDFDGLATYAQLYTDTEEKELIYQADKGDYSFTQVLIK